MLNIVTVQVQNYAGRGGEYLAKLYAGIARHVPEGTGCRGACFTDDPSTLPEGVEGRQNAPGLTGWWNKLAMFKPDAFDPGERVLYFDLDTIILGDLSGLANYRGHFAALRDPFDGGILNSAIMAWEAGKFDHIWAHWESAGRPQFDPRGDQNWIGQMIGVTPDYWNDLLPGQLVSFKKDCWQRGAIPDDARALFFHGRPRPHECQAQFVKDLWNRPAP